MHALYVILSALAILAAIPVCLVGLWFETDWLMDKSFEWRDRRRLAKQRKDYPND